MTGISEEIERNIQIWTSGLRLVAVIGIVEILIIQDIRAYKTPSGNTSNLVDYFIEKSSEDVSVFFNDLLGIIFLGTLSMLMVTIYLYTKIQSFLICGIILSTLCPLAVTINILAYWFQKKRKIEQEESFHILTPELPSLVVELFLILVTHESTVGIVYKYMREMKDTVQTVLVIIAILCYLSAALFCFFSNLYCLIATCFVNQDIEKTQNKIDRVLAKNKKTRECFASDNKIRKRGSRNGYAVKKV